MAANTINLPEKDYFTLQEIAERWHCSIDSVWYYMNQQLLKPMVLSSSLEKNYIEDRLDVSVIRYLVDRGNNVVTELACMAGSASESSSDSQKYIYLPEYLYLFPRQFNPSGQQIGVDWVEVDSFCDFNGDQFTLGVVYKGFDFNGAQSTLLIDDISPLLNGGSKSIFMCRSFGNAYRSVFRQITISTGPLLCSKEERNRFEKENGIVIGEGLSEELASSEKLILHGRMGLVQEERILAALLELGHAPEALPLYELGKAGVKRDVWSVVKNDKALFSTQKRFNRAWERLTSERRIVYKEKEG